MEGRRERGYEHVDLGECLVEDVWEEKYSAGDSYVAVVGVVHLNAAIVVVGGVEDEG